MTELRLTEIWIYPIKSLGGIRLKRAKVLEKGLAFDRRWMLIDKDGIFLTQRNHPKMSLFQPSLTADYITVTYKEKSGNRPSITFNIDTQTGSDLPVRIWNDTVDAAEVDPKISEWFCDHLSLSCKLVKFPEKNERLIEEDHRTGNEQVSLADAFPFLIIGQASLDDLNNRLNEKMSMERFRPNFVFSGAAPFAEDSWSQFYIGENRFKVVKPCARCVLTTINPATAERGIEPLATLATYRKQDNKVLFGQNVMAIDYSFVNENDRIVLH